MTLTETLAALSLGLSVLIAVVGCTWGVGKIRDIFRKEMEAYRENLRIEMSAHKTNMDARVEVLREEFAESFNGMRQRIADVELFGAHNYIKLPVFEQMMQTFNSTIESAFDRMESRMGRIEDKLDRQHASHNFDGRAHG